MASVDPYKRYQDHYNMQDMYPTITGHCSCGCGRPLDGRKKRWYSQECNNKAYAVFAIIKGGTDAIRKALFQIDKGACRTCGEITEDWEADHIVPVHDGGGGCSIDNFQTLCKSCHLEKSIIQNKD